MWRESAFVCLFVLRSFVVFSLFALKVSWRPETDLLSSFSSAVLIAYEGRPPGLNTTTVLSFFPCKLSVQELQKK